MTELAERMAERLRSADITTRAEAEALTVVERDRLIAVAAWCGVEDAAWDEAIRTLTQRPIMTAAELREHHAGRNGRNFMVSDDGYDDIDQAAKVGWRAPSSWGQDGWDLGDWPYVSIHLRERDQGRFELQTVCEGDHDQYIFDTAADREAAVDYLFLWYAAGKRWAPLRYEDREALDAGTFTVPEKYRGPFSWVRCNAANEKETGA